MVTPSLYLRDAPAERGTAVAFTRAVGDAFQLEPVLARVGAATTLWELPFEQAYAAIVASPTVARVMEELGASPAGRLFVASRATGERIEAPPQTQAQAQPQPRGAPTLLECAALLGCSAADARIVLVATPSVDAANRAAPAPRRPAPPHIDAAARAVFALGEGCERLAALQRNDPLLAVGVLLGAFALGVIVANCAFSATARVLHIALI